ncbi:MAG TPA: alpha/beta hydrolase [Caulobacteraceae bacterium]|jgi:acetyl esterase/lipase
MNPGRGANAVSLDRRAARLLAMLDVGGEPTACGEPAARREALRALAAMADDASAPASVAERAIPGPGGAIPIRLYSPMDADRSARPTLVFFQGGGWVAGDLDSHDGLCRRLCAASGWRLLAVRYRRAPEHRFPAALDDCLATTRWAAAEGASLGIDARRLAVGGDSVGAGLAAAVAQAARDEGGPRLALQLLICPILDVGRTGGSREAFGDGYFVGRTAFARDLGDYAPGVAHDDPRLSPLKAACLAGLPPAIVHTAEFDPFRDEGEAYAARLAAEGVEVTAHRHDGMIHYFYALARAIPYATEAAAMIGGEMQEMAAPA